MEGVTLTQDARQLNGSERAVLDGLLTPAECGVLLQLAKVRGPVRRWHSATGGPSGTAACPLALGLSPPRHPPHSPALSDPLVGTADVASLLWTSSFSSQLN